MKICSSLEKGVSSYNIILEVMGLNMIYDKSSILVIKNMTFFALNCTVLGGIKYHYEKEKGGNKYPCLEAQ